ncbi:MAG: type II toxin-antitoxin system RelB/DinJ family antitoxin [bacterium]
MNTTMQIRIDSLTKTKAQKAFKEMGLDLSSGIKFLLAREINPKNITYICPFGFMHKYNPEVLAKYEKEAEWAIKHSKRYSSTKEMFDDIEAGK